MIKIFLTGLLFLMTSCASAPPVTSVLPDLTFAQLQPVALNVAKIEVFEEYKPGSKTGNIEHEFSPAPLAVARRIVDEKLQAQGSNRVLRVFIEEASVISTPQPVVKNFWGNFRREVAERYDARVALRFELVNEEAPDIIIGRATVISDRTKSILENTTLAERDRINLSLNEAIAQDLYAGFRTTVAETFGFR